LLIDFILLAPHSAAIPLYISSVKLDSVLVLLHL
jgi:hypothetical protein